MKKIWFTTIGIMGSLVVVASCGPSNTQDMDAHISTEDVAVTQVDAQVDHDAIIGGDGMVGCDPKNFTLQRSEPAEVYLVIDRSGSMALSGSAPPATRWDELYAAVDQVLTQFDGAIRFGLLSYPVDAECATSGPQVGVELDNRGVILHHMDIAIPAGGTPTKAALNNAAASLASLGNPTVPKFIILATDGGPNCNYMLSAPCACNTATQDYCCTSFPNTCDFGQMCLDETDTLAAIQSLYTNQGIATFVIGLAGTAEYETLLNAMAVAGGVPQQGGATDYYSAQNQAELASAMSTIAVSVISCVIELEEAPEFPDFVHIYMDGEEIAMEQGDGWSYTDGTNMTIEFNGAACDTLQDGMVHDVTATFACVVN
jgi:von Willebrand factor type A domain